MEEGFGEMLATVGIYQTLEGKESTFGEMFVAIFLLEHKNISSQPPLRRGGVKNIKLLLKDDQIVKPLFEEGFGEMFATVKFIKP
ncbi:hypothetical protein [Dokdonia sp. R78006]|uniref:hypothetical protein n=1 Tax=Dokdonia sp. R78006 TaxID=3093866 RepID=UPI0036D43A69